MKIKEIYDTVYSQTYIDKLLSDLLLVGKSKMLGYLPINTLVNICKTPISQMIEYAKKHDLGYVLVSDESIASGALYFYDKKLLPKFLIRHKNHFSKAHVPWDNPVKFIRYIARYLVQEPIAYSLIGYAFNDDRFTEEPQYEN